MFSSVLEGAMANRGVEIHPLTADRWDDLAAMFGDKGAYGGCWCMFFRLPGREFSEGARGSGTGNRAALRSLVSARRIPGLIGYLDGKPVGWVSIAPREEYGRVERSAMRSAVDDRPVWSIVCFFVHRSARRKGVAEAMLAGAVEYARDRGARLVEAYPVDPRVRKVPSAEAYVGLLPMFEAAGFREVARPYRSRAVVRRAIRPTRRARPRTSTAAGRRG
jgi:GNAT superfamily N-acetyltransferase